MVPVIDQGALVRKHLPYLEKIIIPPELMVSHYERLCLASLALEYNQGCEALEFGTWRGLTTYYLAKVLPKKKIWTIDCPSELKPDFNPLQPNETIPECDIGADFKNERTKIQQILMDSINFKIEEHHLGDLDFVFVDGNHDVEHVEHDISEALKKLVPGGLLLVHNYNNRHTAVKETLGQYVEDGICWYVQNHPEFNWKTIENTCIVYFER